MEKQTSKSLGVQYIITEMYKLIYTEPTEDCLMKHFAQCQIHISI